MKKPAPKTRKSNSAATRTKTRRTPQAARNPARTKGAPAKRPAVEPVAAVDPKRPSGKLGQVLDAVADHKGASLAELVELTGWQAHTARAALCRLRQRGFPIGLDAADGRKAYKLPEAASQ